MLLLTLVQWILILIERTAAPIPYHMSVVTSTTTTNDITTTFTMTNISTLTHYLSPVSLLVTLLLLLIRTSVHNRARCTFVIVVGGGCGGGSTLVTAFGTFVVGITRRGRTPRWRRHWWRVMAIWNRLSVAELGRR